MNKSRTRKLLTGSMPEAYSKEEITIPSWLLIAISLVGIILMIGSCTATPAHASELKASWYSNQSLVKEGTWKRSGGIMANGRRFDENALTCATRLYPLGTHLLITNLDNGKSVTVKVTDRIGKRFAKTRIDLSKGAFKRIANLKKGLIPIKVNEFNINIKKGA